MAFLAAGTVVSLVFGLIAVALAKGLTYRRRCAPLARGRLERAIGWFTGIAAGPLALLVLRMMGTMGPHFEEELMMLGPLLAMPATATMVWLAGELLAGPASRNGRAIIGAYLAAQVGFVLTAIISVLVARAVLEKAGENLAIDQAVHLATVLLPFLAGGVASAWAYRGLRGDSAGRCQRLCQRPMDR